jgi:Conserved hypothetical protein (DUF2461)
MPVRPPNVSRAQVAAINSKKREAEAEETGSSATPTRQSKRVKSSQSTPASSAKATPSSTKSRKPSTTKSKYFEGDKNEKDGTGKGRKKSKAVTPPDSETEDIEEDEDDSRESTFAPEDIASREATAFSDEEEEEEVKPKKGKVPTGRELLREGVKTGLGAGKEVRIALPKARQAGKTPYEDDQIHPNTMLFLGDLKKNNDREWLKWHDADFRSSEKDWKSFVEKLSEKVIEKDETIPELPVKDVVYRIYRDIRFSPDPTPYKVSDYK